MRRLTQLALLLALAARPASADSVILFITDGMGLEHMKLGQDAAGAPWTGFPHFAIVDPTSLCGVPDSAAAATAIATGRRTENRRIGTLEDGSPVRTLAEVVRGRGFRVGIVTNDRLTGATPAAFYAHVADRKEREAIAGFLFRSGFELFIGGGGEYLPRFKAGGAGYDYRTSLDRPLGPRALVVLDDEEMPYLLDEPEKGRLLPAVQRALERLTRDRRPFFLLIESALVDHAAHENDAARLAAEMSGNTRAVASHLQDWVARHPGTVLVATADHECGGFTAASPSFATDDHTDAPVAVLSTRPLPPDLDEQWELHGYLLELMQAPSR
jgi:alkaline phosphatase